MRHPMMIAAALCGALALSACTSPFQKNRTVFDGRSYKSKLDVSKDDPAAVMASVGATSETLAGAREAVRHRATTHCIKQYGSSDIVWDISPDAEEPNIVNGNLVVKGRCLGW
ncbi:hypothetical protein [Litorivita sp. NS0012-18]|uniref:hypothetical protein n=1 Tax=Litorivita sp. NS0012-18 TaxID=3127655 RepID=UPI003108CF7D